MKGVLLREAIKLNREHKRRKIWHKLAGIMAGIVVFCTTYALILPAITMGRDPVCGLEAHEHEEACYEERITDELVCELPEDDQGGHFHTDSCYKTERFLICEKQEHVHEDSCYPLEKEEDSDPQLICGMGEHVHGEDCYDEERFLICTIPEHTHSEECVAEGQEWKSGTVISEGTGTSGGNGTTPGETAGGNGTESETAGESGGQDTETETAGETDPEDTETETAGEADPEDAGTETDEETADETDPEYRTLQYEGPDYTVTVSFTEEAEIPEEAVLKVRELERDSEEYSSYYLQAREVLLESLNDTEKEVSFARFFDISFLLGETEIEPAASVDIRIDYLSEMELTGDEESYAVHFAEDGIEVLDADLQAGGRTDVPETDGAGPPGADETEPPGADEATAEQPDQGTQENADLESSDQSMQENTESETVSGNTVSQNQISQNSITFSQDSFSVSGIMVLSTAPLVPGAYNVLDSVTFEPGEQYVLFTQSGDDYLAVTGQMDRIPVEITVNADNTISYDQTEQDIFWKFTTSVTSNNKDIVIQNTGTTRYLHSFQNSATDYNITTAGGWASRLIPYYENGEMVFVVKSNANYIRLTQENGQTVFSVTQDESEAARFRLARLVPDAEELVCDIWLDGTLGGLSSMSGAGESHYSVTAGETFILPEQWTSPTQYPYTLRGWYDVTNSRYYEPGTEVTVEGDAVFYADWVSSNYDVGQQDMDHLEETIDTSDFVTIDVFDYNFLFNMYSTIHTGEISETAHYEWWRVAEYDGDQVPYTDENLSGTALDFIFRDWDYGHHISHPMNTQTNANNPQNDSLGDVTAGILGAAGAATDTGQIILDMLFNTDPNRFVLGANHVGSANHLFQYMEDESSEYYGYYYYDSTLNAASYNQSQSRFYVYDYLERTLSSSESDFLPLNSPYLAAASGLDYLEDTSNGTRRYLYQADGEENDNLVTNYLFGMKTGIHFYLPNDCGETDDFGNYGNLGTNGTPMVFEFSGDDDVWVFVDGKLLLDIGGIHGVEDGKIDFSQGTVTQGGTVKTFEELGLDIGEGAHDLTIYYLERGSGQSNCKIYFNLAPRYSLELEKQDYVNGEQLHDGIQFQVFTDAACTQEAELWDTHADAKAGLPSKSIFEVKDGTASFFGLVAGKTYYIKEIQAAEGYLQPDDVIRVALGNRGISTSVASIIQVGDERDDGFELISNTLNEDTLNVHLILSNQQENSETTQLKVKKIWGEGATEIPESITVYLTINGERTQRSITLDEYNGLTYAWSGLPLKDENGDEIQYGVEEAWVPGFTDSVSEAVITDTPFEEWTSVKSLNDGETYLLTYNDKALSANTDGSFSWVEIESAKTSNAALWNISAGGENGILIHNKNGQVITLNGTDYFAAYDPDGSSANNELYYDSENSNILAMNSNTIYRFGELQSTTSYADAVQDTASAISFGILRQDSYTGRVISYELTNTPIPEDEQTSVTVKKEWETDENYIGYEVVIHLLADGEFTGRTLILDRSNSWSGTFEGLAYYQEDGETAVEYTVEEEKMAGYSVDYSVVIQQGETKTEWETSDDLSGLEEGKIYRFQQYGTSQYLAANGSSLTMTSGDTSDTYQQWLYENGKLQNVGLKNDGESSWLNYNSSNQRLRLSSSGSSISLVDSSKLKITAGNTARYLAVSGTSVSASRSATDFVLYEQKEVTTAPSTTITVTNTYSGYVLPETGGNSILYYALGVLFLMTAALMYMLIPKTKR